MDVFKFPKDMADKSAEFVRAFLLSPDFTQVQRKRIAHSLNLEVKQQSQAAQLATLISDRVYKSQGIGLRSALEIIVPLLPQRPRRYVTLDYVSGYTLPKLGDPILLPVQLGEQGWYGPIHVPDKPFQTWYVRTLLLNYSVKERREVRNVDGELELVEDTKSYTVRWLCFACVQGNSLSLHWSNFQIEDGWITINNNDQQGKFPYWDYIPKFSLEIQEHLKVKAQAIRLDQIIFDRFWYNYRHNNEFEWTDVRIRGEQRGVALTASGRAAKISAKTQRVPITESEEDDEIDGAVDVVGIRVLAQTIRKAVDKAITKTQGAIIQDKEFIDDEILRALIMNHNPISYEVKIRKKEGDALVYGADAYFGKKSGHTPDSFYHLHLQNINELDGMGHVELLMKELDTVNHLGKTDGNDSSPQLKLF